MKEDLDVSATMTGTSPMCDHSPATADSLENYRLDTESRTVGQIVTVSCRNATVAIVKCMPNLQWNATIPSCQAEETHSDAMSTVLIILWVVGAVLLVSLVLLIVVIVRTKSKARCGLESTTHSPGPSVFHISGRGPRRGRGGDNPAFSRADEICGEWSYHRGETFPDSQRLPSYHEAISNSCMTVPVRTRQASHQTSSSARNSSVLIDSNRHLQILGANFLLENSPLPDAQSRREGAAAETDLQIPSAQNNQGREDSSADTAAVSGEEASRVSGLAKQRHGQVAGYTARRYADNYPRCFFEDEPPPPYSVQPANYSSNRSAQQQQQRQQQQQQQYQQPPQQIQQQQQQQQPQSSGNENHPSQRRSTHPVTSFRPGSNQTAHNFSHNQHSRRSMFETSTNSAPARILHRSPTHIQHSISNSSSNHIYPRQNEHEYNSRPRAHNSRTLSNASSLVSEPSSDTYPPVRAQTPRHFNDERMVRHSSSANYVLPASCRPGVSQNLPAASPVPGNYVDNDQMGYRSEFLSTESRDNLEHGHIQIPASQGAYYDRNCHGVEPALAYSSLNRSHHSQVPPLGTSTPVSQSPLETRRFVPVSHPSPLPIPRGYPSHVSSSRQQTTPRDYLTGETRHGAAMQDMLPGQTRLLKDGHQIWPRLQHTDPGSAPLARFDADYTYL